MRLRLALRSSHTPRFGSLPSEENTTSVQHSVAIVVLGRSNFLGLLAQRVGSLHTATVVSSEARVASFTGFEAGFDYVRVLTRYPSAATAYARALGARKAYRINMMM